MVDFFYRVWRNAATTGIHFDEVDMGREKTALDCTLKPVDCLVAILRHSAAAHVEFAEGAHDPSVAGLREGKPVVVHAFMVEGLYVEPSPKKAVGAGAAGLRCLGEKMHCGSPVARNTVALKVEKPEFNPGIDPTRCGGGLDVRDNKATIGRCL